MAVDFSEIVELLEFGGMIEIVGTIEFVEISNCCFFILLVTLSVSPVSAPGVGAGAMSGPWSTSIIPFAASR